MFNCPFKAETRDSISMLMDASCVCTVITGDSLLTGSQVVISLGMCGPKLLLLRVQGDEDTKALVTDKAVDECWVSVDGNTILPLPKSRTEVKSLVDQGYSFGVSGVGLNHLMNTGCLAWYLRHIYVYARVTPAQKEAIVRAMKDRGYVTLMCGDGTNDVGALKVAHVGVSLVSGGKVEGEEDKKPVVVKPEPKKAPVPTQPTRPLSWREQMEKAMEDAKKLEAEDQSAIAKLGDASIASPFTSKGTSIGVVIEIIKHGMYDV